MKNRTNLSLLLAIILCLTASNISLAQCPQPGDFLNDNLFLTTQAEIDNFCINTYPGCTALPAGVNLVIDDTGTGNITNLDGLNCLTGIGGFLGIYSNAMLTDINGLANVTSIGGFLEIFDNNSLQTLAGLANVTNVGGYLSVDENNQLTDCCILCALLAEDALDDTVIDGPISISANNAGCQSQADIEACSPCTRPKVCDAEAGSF